MKPIEQMRYHPTTEKLVKILQSKTQNSNPLFLGLLLLITYQLLHHKCV